MNRRSKRQSPIEDPDDIALDLTYQPPAKIRGPLMLLRDSSALELACQIASVGGSIGSIEAKLSLRPGELRQWLKIGSRQAEPPESPYRQLYETLRNAAADARIVAESTLREKNPAKWLEMNSLTRIVERVRPAVKHIPKGPDIAMVSQRERLQQLVPNAHRVLVQQGYLEGKVIEPNEKCNGQAEEKGL